MKDSWRDRRNAVGSNSVAESHNEMLSGVLIWELLKIMIIRLMNICVWYFGLSRAVWTAWRMMGTVTYRNKLLMKRNSSGVSWRLVRLEEDTMNINDVAVKGPTAALWKGSVVLFVHTLNEPVYRMWYEHWRILITPFNWIRTQSDIASMISSDVSGHPSDSKALLSSKKTTLEACTTERE